MGGTTNLTRTEARERAALLTVDSYDIYLDLDSGESTFISSTTVRFRCRQPGAVTFIDLIAPSVRGIVLNGRELEPDCFDGARIVLTDLHELNELVVDAQCAYMNTGEGLHRFVDPVDDEVYLYSQFEVADARRVFACFDQPDLKARFSFTVRAPEHWKVISNSPTPKPEVLDYSGTATWRFAPTQVLPTYVTAIIAGPYRGATGTVTSRNRHKIPLGVYCRASLAEHLDASEIMHVTKQGFGHYEKLFARGFPFEKYDQVFVPEFNAGAMENAAAVTFLETYVFRSKPTDAMVERRALTILHELAHMWFGDLVTMRWWDDLWLNESFAEYASTRCMVEATRWHGAWTTFSSMEKSWAYRQDQLPSTHPIVADIRDLEDVEVNFDGITYAKGASVLKQLVAWVGHEAFDEGVRRYFVEHAWGNTELSDLLATLEKTSGRDLTSWSRAWLQQAGLNTLRPQIVDEQGVITSLAIEQTAPPGQVLRPHRLAVAGYEPDPSGRMTRSWRVEQDVDGLLTPVDAAVGRPRPALLLINDGDLAYTKVRLDEQSMATAMAGLSSFTDSLPRALIWGAAWDMTRDADLPATDFVNLVCENISAETDSSVLMTVLRQLQTTVLFYVAPDRRDQTRDRVCDRMIDVAQRALPGHDQQLQMVKAAALNLRSAEQIDWARGLLDGTRVLEGLTVDTDLRWELLCGLVAAGAAGEPEIEAELARDDTATGRRQAAGARATIPTPEAKRAAWHSIVDRADLPNAVQSAVIAGFTRVHDPVLLKPFVEPYFAALQTIWQTRTNEIGQQLVIGLFPAQLSSTELLESTQAWLDEVGERWPALTRLVVENADLMRRALAAQARDSG